MDKRNRMTSLVSDAAWRFGKIAAPLGKALLFSAADEHISYKKDLCIAIEKGGVSVAYGTRFLSSISIKGVRHHPFKDSIYPQPKETASAVTLAVHGLGISVSAATLSIPKHWAAVKIAEFPATVKENLSDVITYELDRLVPFSPESAYYDFIVDSETPEKITVAVVAVKADIIKSYREAIQEAGISVNRVTLNITAMGELCRSAGRSEHFMFVGTDGSEYEGALFIDGRLCGVVSERFTGADDSARGVIISEGMKLLVDSARKRNVTLRPPVFMSGGSPALAEKLKTILGLPVSRLDGYHTASGSDSTAAGGLMESLRPGAHRLDLLSRGRHELPAVPKALSIMLALLLIACWIFYVMAPIQLEEKRLEGIEHQVKLLKGKTKDLDVLQKDIDTANSQIETVNNFREGRPATLSLIKELTTVLPKSVWLTRLRITMSTVEIEGYSSSPSELLSRLETSKYFRKAEFSSPTFRDIRLNTDRFSIKMEIRGVKVEKVEKEVQKKNEQK